MCVRQVKPDITFEDRYIAAMIACAAQGDSYRADKIFAEYETTLRLIRERRNDEAIH
jgi:hypothetical protein